MSTTQYYSVLNTEPRRAPPKCSEISSSTHRRECKRKCILNCCYITVEFSSLLSSCRSDHSIEKFMNLAASCSRWCWAHLTERILLSTSCWTHLVGVMLLISYIVRITLERTKLWISYSHLTFLGMPRVGVILDSRFLNCPQASDSKSQLLSKKFLPNSTKRSIHLSFY